MNVPKLRFKEFNDEWKKSSLGDFFSISAGGDIDKSHVSNIRTEKYQYPIYANALTNNGLYGYSDIFKIDGNSITVTGRGDIGKGLARNGKYYPIVRLLVLKSNNEFNNIFFANAINNINLYQESTGVPQLTSPQLGNYKVFYPSISEQNKIGNTLELIDKKIELQSKKIENLKLFKLYIRKTAFLLNTDSNIKLKEIVNCESSNITLTDMEDDDGMYPVYGATGFIKNIKNYKFDSEYIAIIKDGVGVGRTMICPKNSSILATMNALTIKSNYPLNYICEMINTINFDKYIVGSGIPHIYFKDYGNEKFMLHNEKDANLFNNIFKCIDKKIELLNDKLDKLNTLKKGLMQNMFV